MFRIYHSICGEKPYTVEAIGITCGDDVIVVVCGGTRYHVGATALAVSGCRINGLSSVASVLCVQGHKEDELARSSAEKLSSVLGCSVTVTIGIHIDNATSDEIHILCCNCDKAINQLLDQLRHHNGSYVDI